MTGSSEPDVKQTEPSRPGEVFRAFLKLGLTSFGGPIAHIGYFRTELVMRRRWISEAGYADLVALCQFLPGPTSSQVGFALGLLRAGPLGGLAAWAAFTLPSALCLVLLAHASALFDGPVAESLLHGLKLVAVAIVAQAVWGMTKTLTPDRSRAAIALVAILIVTLFAGVLSQMAALVAGCLAGLLLCRDRSGLPEEHVRFPVSRRAGLVAFALFCGLLLALPLLAASSASHGVAIFDAFYRAGALVLGGGHVVLPLLQAEIVPTQWVTSDVFLSGYAVTQAMPGPLFTVAAFLGTAMTAPPNGVAGAAIALVAIFLPGLLLVVAALPFRDSMRDMPLVQAAMRGANAAVVGILAAALYDPLWTGSVFGPRDFAQAVCGFLLLTVWNAPPWTVVILLSATSVMVR